MSGYKIDDGKLSIHSAVSGNAEDILDPESFESAMAKLKENRILYQKLKQEHEIGAGAQGAVIQLTWSTDDQKKTTAVGKVYTANTFDDAVKNNDELMILAKLNDNNDENFKTHENIIKFYGLSFDEETKTAYMVLENGGTSLRKHLNSAKKANDTSPENFKFRGRTSLEIMYEVALGLEYLHKTNGKYKIAWRDLKPGNILVTSIRDKPTEAENRQLSLENSPSFNLGEDLEANDNENNVWNEDRKNVSVKLIDFGISKTSSDKTTYEQDAGTFEYGPDTTHEGNRNRPTDMYSAGIVLHELIHQKPPPKYYDHPNMEIKEDLPDELKSLILSLKKKRPEDRPDASELVVKIKALLNNRKKVMEIDEAFFYKDIFDIIRSLNKLDLGLMVALMALFFMMIGFFFTLIIVCEKPEEWVPDKFFYPELNQTQKTTCENRGTVGNFTVILYDTACYCCPTNQLKKNLTKDGSNNNIVDPCNLYSVENQNNKSSVPYNHDQDPDSLYQKELKEYNFDKDSCNEELDFADDDYDDDYDDLTITFKTEFCTLAPHGENSAEAVTNLLLIAISYIVVLAAVYFFRKQHYEKASKEAKKKADERGFDQDWLVKVESRTK